ncbi:MAG: Type 1 glutamine amidotransferase-like domain-containing protein [Deltaproteobacteria bacterium]|nr:Type 1 glutamine amidotransferase-like domain-containing protein [Deltaproteobacteria bacterium]
MPKKIALVGGNEFRPNCEPMDRALLAQFGKRPRVRILPTAAQENPRLAAQNGIRYFEKLGAEAEAVNILNRLDAQNPALISLLEEADLFYFAGGNPIYLLEVFKDSPAWSEMVRLWRHDRLLAGSSAGAMILGEKIWDPGKGWRAGLGLLPGLAVLPHRAVLASRWDLREMLRSLPATFTLAGIDEATALAGPPWQVLGIGEVVLYRAGQISPTPHVFKRGQEVIFPNT